MRLRRNTRSEPQLHDKDYLFLAALATDLRQAIADLPGRDLTVLDVGSTYRPYESLFAGKCQHFWSLDRYSPDPSLRIAGLAEELPIASESVDVCLCTQVLEHVERPEAVISELARVLKPSGSLLLSTHGVFRHHPFPHDYWRWTEEGLRKILERHFHSVGIRPNGGTLLVLFHIVNSGIYYLAEHRKYLRFLQYTVYPALNVMGRVMDSLVNERSLAVNYLAIASKGTRKANAV